MAAVPLNALLSTALVDLTRQYEAEGAGTSLPPVGLWSNYLRAVVGGDDAPVRARTLDVGEIDAALAGEPDSGRHRGPGVDFLAPVVTLRRADLAERVHVRIGKRVRSLPFVPA